LDSAIAQDFAKEMNKIHPEIHNRMLLSELNRGRHYLRKSELVAPERSGSGSICGSFLSFSCSLVSIRGAVNSCLFAVAFDL
jgi:hypothetical protein